MKIKVNKIYEVWFITKRKIFMDIVNSRQSHTVALKLLYIYLYIYIYSYIIYRNTIL